MKLNTISVGNALDIPSQFAAGSVQCIITSPPYWGLRDYGIEPMNWPEVVYSPMAGLPPLTIPAESACLGLERTPEAYTAHLVAIWRGLWRVLRDDGVCFLNLGDSYAGGGRGGGGSYQKERPGWGIHGTGSRCPVTLGLKPKDLLGVPWRVAFALQADGWYLRQDVVWAKGVSGQAIMRRNDCEKQWSGNPMPESIQDRCSKAHELIFILTKKARYYWDAEAVKETSTDPESYRGWSKRSKQVACGAGPKHTQTRGFDTMPEGKYYPTRNLRSVWTIATKGFSEAHFAVFAEDIPRICIKAGTSEHGSCPKCGSPFERVVKKDRTRTTAGLSALPEYKECKTQTIGWRPTCSCLGTWYEQRHIGIDGKTWKARYYIPFDPKPPQLNPCVVLDPFVGSGTTCKVARELKRNWIGIDVKEEYAEMARKRIFEKSKSKSKKVLKPKSSFRLF